MKYKVGDKVIMNPERSKRPGVFTITSISVGSPTFYKLSDSNGKPAGEWLAESIIKVPLFKVGQIVQFKNIREDRWYPHTIEMAEIENELGVVAEVKENHYTADKPYQDGCLYVVKALQKGNIWHVTSASLKLVTSTLEDVKSVSQDDPGPIGDDGALAIAQAVDNVKSSPFPFKIGDVVVIRNDLIAGKTYDEWVYGNNEGWFVNPEMKEYFGKVAKVTHYSDDDPHYCRLDIDKGYWSWIQDSLLHYTPGSDYDLDKQIINQLTNNNRYENQLQGKEEPLIGGCECTGTGVCYPGEQAATCIGHLGYRKITYRS